MLLPAILAPVASAATAETTGELDVPPLPDGRPNGLVGPAAVYLGEASYVLGGRMADRATFSDAIYRYDHRTGASEIVARLPPIASAVGNGRFAGAAALVETSAGPRIYYFGGAAQIPVVLRPGSDPVPIPTSIKDIVEFDPTTNRVTKLAEQLPISMWGMSAVAYGSTIYLFGGFSFNIPAQEYGRHDTVLAFEPNGALGGRPLLRELPGRLPLKVQDAGATLIANRVYLFGGMADRTNTTDANVCPRVNDTACETDAVIAFNPDAERVLGVTSRLRDATSGVSFRVQWSSAATVNGKAYIMGGSLSNRVASSAILEFDPTRLTSPTRVLTPTLPVGVIAAGVSTNGALIHLFGGRGDNEISGYSSVITVDPRATAPWAPRAPVAAKEDTAVRVTWEPPAYNGESPITAYRVYRVVDAEETFLKETTDLALTDTTVQPNVAYVYRITAVNAVGESRTSARASLTSDVVPPSDVRSLTLVPGDSNIQLFWEPPASDGGSALSGYRVYRNESSTPIASLPPTTTSYVDRSVTNGVRYGYRVEAWNVKGEGAAAPLRDGTPIAAPPAPLLTRVARVDAGVVIEWIPPQATVVGFIVLRGTSPANLTQRFPVGPDAGAFTDTTAQEGRTYYYAVQAENAVGAGSYSDVGSISLVSKPSAPRNVLAAPLDGAVRLTWQPPEDTGKVAASDLSYTVVRDGQRIATDIRALTFTDRTAQVNRTYSYAVLAFNGLESDASDTASAAARMPVNKPPVAVVAVLQPIVLAGDLVDIDASQSSDEDGSITRYVFDFGDGTAPVEAQTASAAHAFTKNGTYVVTLVAHDNRNAASEPARASVQVGVVTPDDMPRPDPATPPTGPTGDPPGTSRPKIPGPGVPLLVAMVVLAALARRPVHPRR